MGYGAQADLRTARSGRADPRGNISHTRNCYEVKICAAAVAAMECARDYQQSWIKEALRHPDICQPPDWIEGVCQRRQGKSGSLRNHGCQAASTAVLEPQFPAVSPERKFSDRKPKPASDRGLVAPSEEAFCDPGELILGYAGSLILDDDRHLLRGLGETAADGATRRGMADGVLQQISGGQREEFRFDLQLCFLEVGSNLDGNVPCRIGKFFCQRSQDRRGPHDSLLRSRVPGLDRRHVEQLTDKPPRAIYPHDDLLEGLIADRLLFAEERDLCLRFQSGQRRTQLMGSKGNEVTFALTKGGQPREQPVQ